MDKSRDAFRTISEVADWLGTPTHVLRFWESRFTQIKPVKRAGGRRYYRPADMELLGGIKKLLHDDGLTIRGVQKILREQGVRHVAGLSQPIDGAPQEAGFAQNVEPEALAGEVVSMRPEWRKPLRAQVSNGGRGAEDAVAATPRPDAAAQDVSAEAETEDEPAAVEQPAADTPASSRSAPSPLPPDQHAGIYNPFARLGSTPPDVEDPPEPPAPSVEEIESREEYALSDEAAEAPAEADEKWSEDTPETSEQPAPPAAPAPQDAPEAPNAFVEEDAPASEAAATEDPQQDHSPAPEPTPEPQFHPEPAAEPSPRPDQPVPQQPYDAARLQPSAPAGQSPAAATEGPTAAEIVLRRLREGARPADPAALAPLHARLAALRERMEAPARGAGG